MDAVLLSAVIRADLESLEQVSARGDEPDGSPAEENTDTEAEPAAAAIPDELLVRLARDKTAHHVIAGRLQKQQDTALLANLTEYAESLRRTQQNLFGAYRELKAALNVTAPGASGEADLELLLKECAAQDALADSQHASRVTEDELYLDALKGVGKSDTKTRSKPLFAPTYDAKRERTRIRVLSTVAAVLFAACVGVWGSRLGGAKDPLAVPVTEMSDTLILDDSYSVGPMMYAVVSHWSWDGMSNEERLGSVRALGLSAANHGYETVYLVDESRNELAVWSKADGARLTGAEVAAGPATPS